MPARSSLYNRRVHTAYLGRCGLVSFWHQERGIYPPLVTHSWVAVVTHSWDPRVTHEWGTSGRHEWYSVEEGSGIGSFSEVTGLDIQRKDSRVESLLDELLRSEPVGLEIPSKAVYFLGLGDSWGMKAIILTFAVQKSWGGGASYSPYHINSSK